MTVSIRCLICRSFSPWRFALFALVLFAWGCQGESETTPAEVLSGPELENSEASTKHPTDEPPASEAQSPEQQSSTQSRTEAAPGRRFYFSQAGEGEKDGSDWSNAAPAKELPAFLAEKLIAGDHIFLGSGTFPKFSVKKSGTPELPIVITGVDTGEGLPLLKGGWKQTNPKYHAHSWGAISLADGVEHVQLGRLQINGFIYGINATNNRNLQLFELSITRCREAIALSGVTDSTIRNCRLTKYTKRGVSFEEKCHDLLVADVTADATEGQDDWPTEAYPFGFAVENGGGNHSIRFERCTAQNNVFRDEPGKYWNGDGFIAENKSYGLSYIDCFAFGNSDGGWDDKSRSPQLTGCIAARNKRGFRFWNSRGDSEHPARLENCLGIYNKSAGGSGSSAGLWVCGAVEALNCTFHNNATAAIAIENNAPGGKLRAINCILSHDSQPADRPLVSKEGGTTYEAIGVVQFKGDDPKSNPQFEAADPQWAGHPPTAMNSKRYGNSKGYWYKAK